MTIKQMYDWAIKNNVENLKLICTTNDGFLLFPESIQKDGDCTGNFALLFVDDGMDDAFDNEGYPLK